MTRLSRMGNLGRRPTSLMLAVGLVIVALLAALLVLQLRPTAPPLASRFEDPSESTIPVPPAKDVTAVEQAPNSIATVRQKMVATKPPGTGEGPRDSHCQPDGRLSQCRCRGAFCKGSGGQQPLRESTRTDRTTHAGRWPIGR